MFEKFTEKAINVVSASQENAKLAGATIVAPENLLLALFDEAKGISLKIFKSYDITHEKLVKEIGKYISLTGGKTVQNQTLPFDDEYKEILNEQEPGTPVEFMERFSYYERAKNAYCVVATGETAQYANIILKKGVVYK